jgi:hypothetical protein
VAACEAKLANGKLLRGNQEFEPGTKDARLHHQEVERVL